ncbi:hypothetical protein HMPREF3038_02837 [Akkermansia sp. KLE1797]|nr:hypothetical protein HMPREF3038_02837 [Akkermansia sp. KLE1797]KXU52694.1 hypothetical protein HMPREF3039_03219 [Akkermansia sp. KLE1798]KZA04120.1 hypothetical protein HMPREF1326_02318 [Akkermansia sp. KLE1605]
MGMTGSTGSRQGREIVRFRLFTFPDGKTEGFREKPFLHGCFHFRIFPQWRDFI